MDGRSTGAMNDAACIARRARAAAGIVSRRRTRAATRAAARTGAVMQLSAEAALA